MITRLVLLGADGDLAQRWLVPALAELRVNRRLAEDFRLFGAGLGSRADAFAPVGLDRAGVERVDVREADAIRALLHRAAGPERAPIAVYLALPIEVVPSAVEAIASASWPIGSRVAVEKPFGSDARSAIRLNQLLGEVSGRLGAGAVYRVDHVLGMSGLHNLVALRSSNRLLRELWSAAHIERIDVRWEETIAPRGRAAYYDGAGQLRDVMQNHMLQLLCVAMMEAPAHASIASSRARRIEVLQAARLQLRRDGVPRSRRARYTAGTLAVGGGADGGEVPAYASEPGVDPRRETETWAEVSLRIDTPRWRGTQVRLRAGKALAVRRKGVMVHFRALVGAAPEDASLPERLWIGVEDSTDVELQLTGATLGPPGRREPLALSGPARGSDSSPYEHVLADLLSGASVLAVAPEEPIEAWRLLDPVLASWRQGAVALEEYPAGADGLAGSC